MVWNFWKIFNVIYSFKEKSRHQINSQLLGLKFSSNNSHKSDNKNFIHWKSDWITVWLKCKFLVNNTPALVAVKVLLCEKVENSENWSLFSLKNSIFIYEDVFKNWAMTTKHFSKNVFSFLLFICQKRKLKVLNIKLF